MRPRTVVFLLLCAGLCAGLASCGRPVVAPGTSGVSRQATSTESDRQNAITQWANDYCVAVGSLVDELANLPAIDPSSPRRAVETSGALLGTMIGGLDKAVDGLRALSPGPVPGADQARDTMVERFTGVRADAAAAKQRLDRARGAASIPPGILRDARGPLDEVAAIDPLSGFASVPELSAGAQRAPVCRQLTERETAPQTPATR
ncbi:hypothetical protein [Amycolatopsis rhizosphaerae]|uniref:hypothetical protein n=1 Tax=Amycolatopsis rhizosphaerae TaxID=2053003 RepID=UPI001FE66B8A|nr:hypothetical protein [Amycolatopsis rhizosphaerae]